VLTPVKSAEEKNQIESLLLQEMEKFDPENLPFVPFNAFPFQQDPELGLLFAQREELQKSPLQFIKKTKWYTLYHHTPTGQRTFSLHLIESTKKEEEALQYLFEQHPYYKISFTECLEQEVSGYKNIIEEKKVSLKKLKKVLELEQKCIENYQKAYAHYLSVKQKGVSQKIQEAQKAVTRLEQNTETRPNPFLIEYIQKLIEEIEQENEV
jgi:hypothetical protein